MLRKVSDMKTVTYDQCHDGLGALLCRHVLQNGDSEVGIQYMHDDTIPPGVSIGEHPHTRQEEIYFLVEGAGTMILDGVHHPIAPGDVSLVQRGHTHGLINSGQTPMRLLVIAVKPPS